MARPCQLIRADSQSGRTPDGGEAGQHESARQWELHRSHSAKYRVSVDGAYFLRTRTTCRLGLADCKASDIRPDRVPRLCRCTSQRRAREAMTESMEEAMEADCTEGWTEMRAVEGTTAAAVVADAGE